MTSPSRSPIRTDEPSRAVLIKNSLIGKVRPVGRHVINCVVLLITTSDSIQLKGRFVVTLKAAVLFLFKQKTIPGSQRLDFCPHKTAESVFRCADNGLSANVEACIDD